MKALGRSNKTYVLHRNTFYANQIFTLEIDVTTSFDIYPYNTGHNAKDIVASVVN